MTTAARRVLADCVEAKAALYHGIQGSDWRRAWITVVVLLRVVGHVLDKVDAESDPRLAEIVARKWAEPKPLIFSEFIERERNNILKQYRVSAGQGVTVYPQATQLDLGTGETRALRKPRESTYAYTINEGPLAGRTQHEVLDDAIVWWHQYLDEIDEEYQRGGA